MSGLQLAGRLSPEGRGAPGRLRRRPSGARAAAPSRHGSLLPQGVAARGATAGLREFSFRAARGGAGRGRGRDDASACKGATGARQRTDPQKRNKNGPGRWQRFRLLKTDAAACQGTPGRGVREEGQGPMTGGAPGADEHPPPEDTGWSVASRETLASAGRPRAGRRGQGHLLRERTRQPPAVADRATDAIFLQRPFTDRIPLARRPRLGLGLPQLSSSGCPLGATTPSSALRLAPRLGLVWRLDSLWPPGQRRSHG